MKNNKNEFLLPIEDYLPGQSIDCVILGYEESQLKVLLLKWKYEEVWSLPGGFIKKEEDLDQAALRILETRAGLDSVYLKQFYTFGDNQRSKVKKEKQLIRLQKVLNELDAENSAFVDWISQRFITTGYFALINIANSKPHPDVLSERCEWISITDLPNLMLDHKSIIEKALEHIRIQLNYLPVGRTLLPEKFTMNNLQKLYESLLGAPLERSNFQRKMLKLGIFNRHEKQLTGAANKAPYLYSFDDESYNEIVSRGIGFRF